MHSVWGRYRVPKRGILVVTAQEKYIHFEMPQELLVMIIDIYLISVWQFYQPYKLQFFLCWPCGSHDSLALAALSKPSPTHMVCICANMKVTEIRKPCSDWVLSIASFLCQRRDTIKSNRIESNRNRNRKSRKTVTTSSATRRDKFDSKVRGLQSKCHKQRTGPRARQNGRAKSRQQRNRLPDWNPNKADPEQARPKPGCVALGMCGGRQLWT